MSARLAKVRARTAKVCSRWAKVGFLGLKVGFALPFVQNQGVVGGCKTKFLMMDSPFLTSNGGVVWGSTPSPETVRVRVEGVGEHITKKGLKK